MCSEKLIVHLGVTNKSTEKAIYTIKRLDQISAAVHLWQLPQSKIAHWQGPYIAHKSEDLASGDTNRNGTKSLVWHMHTYACRVRQVCHHNMWA